MLIPREGQRVAVLVNANGRARSSVTISRLLPDEQTLAVDELNVVDAAKREAFLCRIPEDVRAEAARLLESIAVQLAEMPHEAADDGRDPVQGSAIEFEEPDPWPEAVDGAKLLDEIAYAIGRFAVLPEGAADATALWAVHAYALDAAQISPVLAITSPEKGCGKTTVLAVLQALVPRAVPTSNITTASLFRTVEKFRPTLLIDEGDTFLRDNQELRGILNSGHLRASAFVIRTVGEDFEPRRFTTWCPKAIAAIGKLPDTLADRSISIRMHRLAPGEAVAGLRLDRLLSDLAPLRRKAVRWAADHIDKLDEGDPEVPDALGYRQADNWRPLLAIAELAGGDWPARARRAALLLSGQRAADATPAVQLLADLRELFAARRTDRLSTAEIIQYLQSREDRPWPEWARGRPITPQALARLLGRFGIAPENIRVGANGVVAKGYKLEQFRDAFVRYLPPESATNATAKENSDLHDAGPATPSSVVADSRSFKMNGGADVAPVADLPRDTGGTEWF